MKRLLSIAIVAALLLASSVSGASALSYADTTSVSSTSTEVDQGKTGGQTSGKIDGGVAGKLDFAAGKKADPNTALPADTEIQSKYNLLNDTPTYRAAFLAAYKTAFKEEYIAAYRAASLAAASDNPAQKGGESLGSAYGTRDAMFDYQRGWNNDPDGSYKRFIAATNIDLQFNLNKENAEYIKAFKAAFERKYKESYSKAYQERNVSFELDSTAVYEISYSAENLKLSWPLYNVSSGSVSTKTQYECSLDIPPGAIYEPTYINIAGLQHSFNARNYRYTAVTPIFRVTLNNKSGDHRFRQPVQMSFPYHGSEKVGIYRWQNNRWEYLPTYVGDGVISTEFPAGKVLSGEYAIFIDENSAVIRDSVLHWAGREIQTFARRHYIDGNVLFRPDAPITRLEMARLLYALLSNKYAYNYAPTLTDIPYDHPNFGAVRFVTANRFMNPDASGRFYPDEKVRYEHLEFIFRNIRGTTINWSEVASRMLQEKYTRSEWLKGGAFVTRAEALYFLHEYFMD